MLFTNSRSIRLIIGTLLAVTFSVGSVEANSGRATVNTIKNPDLVQITPIVLDGQNADLVKVGNLPEFSVRAELPEANLTQAEKEQLSEIRRDILDKTITGLVLSASELPMLVGDNSITKATTVESEQLAENIQYDPFEVIRDGIEIQKVEGETATAVKERKSLRERAAAFIGFLNENILRSTYQAGRGFVRDSKGTKGYREFGLSVVFRGEFQVGVGKLNMMRTLARGLDLGYDVKSKELVIRTVTRHEKMDGGTAMALGPKMELRAYRANLDIQEHLSHEGHVHGKSWYPPAPPLVTFASESFPGYHSIGTALALNVFDVVVPTYLFNTVNEFDADYQVRRISLSPTNYARLTVAAVRSWLKRPGPSANQCRAIFSRAF